MNDLTVLQAKVPPKLRKTLLLYGQDFKVQGRTSRVPRAPENGIGFNMDCGNCNGKRMYHRRKYVATELGRRWGTITNNT